MSEHPKTSSDIKVLTVLLITSCGGEYAPADDASVCLPGETNDIGWDEDPGIGATADAALDRLGGSYAVAWTDVFVGEGFVGDLDADELVIAPARSDDLPQYHTLSSAIEAAPPCPAAWIDFTMSGTMGLTALAAEGALDGHEWLATSRAEVTGPGVEVAASLGSELAADSALAEELGRRYIAGRSPDHSPLAATVNASLRESGSALIDLSVIALHPDGSLEIATIQRGHWAASQ